MPYYRVDCNVMKRVGGVCLLGLDKMELQDDLQGRTKPDHFYFYFKGFGETGKSPDFGDVTVDQMGFKILCQQSVSDDCHHC